MPGPIETGDMKVLTITEATEAGLARRLALGLAIGITGFTRRFIPLIRPFITRVPS
jgi:hypothetical protein